MTRDELRTPAVLIGLMLFGLIVATVFGGFQGLVSALIVGLAGLVVGLVAFR
jgi:hypothetical protein